MVNFTADEKNLICVYGFDKGRLGAIAALEEMRKVLKPHETRLRDLTDSAIAKLRQCSEEEVEAIDDEFPILELLEEAIHGK